MRTILDISVKHFANFSVLDFAISSSKSGFEVVKMSIEINSQMFVVYVLTFN